MLHPVLHDKYYHVRGEKAATSSAWFQRIKWVALWSIFGFSPDVVGILLVGISHFLAMALVWIFTKR
jgi:hypothetical protein